MIWLAIVLGLATGAMVFLRWSRRRRIRHAMVLRMQEPAAMRQLLGAAGMAELVAAISARLSRELRLRGALHATEAGEFRVLLPPRRDRQVRVLARVVAGLLRQGVPTSRGWVRPVFAGALVREGDDPAHPGQLFDFGRAVLTQDVGQVGALPVMTYFPLQRAVPPLPPAYDPDWLEMRFRPRLCADSGIVPSVEAWAVLHHPGGGALAQDQFLPRLTVEDLSRTTQDMIRHALTALRDWDAANAGIGQIALPLSQAQLCLPDLAETLLWELDRQDVPPARLCLILPSPTGMGAARAKENLLRLTTAGCRVEVEDIAAADIAPATMHGAAGATLRLTRGFTRDCDRRVEQQRMILAILALADHRGARTVATAIDTPGERSFLAQIGVDLLQGDAVSAPLSQAEVADFALKHRQPPGFALPPRRVG